MRRGLARFGIPSFSGSQPLGPHDGPARASYRPTSDERAGSRTSRGGRGCEPFDGPAGRTRRRRCRHRPWRLGRPVPARSDPSRHGARLADLAVADAALAHADPGVAHPACAHAACAHALPAHALPADAPGADAPGADAPGADAPPADAVLARPDRLAGPDWLAGAHGDPAPDSESG